VSHFYLFLSRDIFYHEILFLRGRISNVNAESRPAIAHLAFFQIFSRFFLIFNVWNCLRGTNKSFYNRLLPAYKFMYHS